MSDLPELKFDDDNKDDELPELAFDELADGPLPEMAPRPDASEYAASDKPVISFGRMPRPGSGERPATIGEEVGQVGSALHDFLTKGRLPRPIDDGLANLREGMPGAGLAQKAGAALRATVSDGDLEYSQRYDKQLGQIKSDRAERHKRDPEAAARAEALGAMIGGPSGGAQTALGRIGVEAGVAAADRATRADSVAEAKKDAIEGGLWAGGTQAFLESLGGLGRFLKGLGERRAVKSIEPTLSQQEGLARKGAEERLGRELLDNDVVRFGSNVDDMAPRVEGLLADKGRKIGDIRAEADAAGATVDMSRLKSKGDAKVAFSDATNETAQDAAAAYARNADNFAKVPQRTIGETQEEILALNSQIPFAKDVADMTPSQQAYKELRGDLVSQMDDQIRQRVPGRVGEYADLKETFGLFKDADKILDKSTARNARNADIGLRELLATNAAAKRGAAGGLKTAAVAAGTKLARERGNAALAVTADRMSQLLGASPERLGRFTQPLMEAARRGNTALLVTHAMLMDDPEYAAIVGGEEIK